MKSKRWKVFWIVCGILAAVGIVLAVAGTILGGFGILRSREDENIIRRWLNRIGITNEVTVSSELDNIDDLGDIGFFTDSEYVSGEVNGDTVTDFYGINELDIELAGMGVYVLPYDGDSIIVDTSYCRDDLRKRIHVWQEDTELKVEMEDGGRLTTENSGVMYISVPRGTYFQKISVDAQAGFIEMTEVEADQMLASAGAGQVVLTSFSVRSLEAECGAGQIVLEGEVTDRVDLQCDLGNIQCTLPGSSDAYNYEVNCDLGEVMINGESYSSFHNRIKADHGSGSEIKAECNLGSIELMFK